MVSRFVAEARAVNQIRHRNIIDIFSFGQLADGRHYYVMELLDGEPLDATCAARALASSEAIPILRAIARALDAAHAKGIAHRDLKPRTSSSRRRDGGRSRSCSTSASRSCRAPRRPLAHKTGPACRSERRTTCRRACRGRDVDTAPTSIVSASRVSGC
jgi:serine/threonine protein kinase